MSAAPAYHFDQVAADRVVRWFERYLTHVKGEYSGLPLKLEDWQRTLLMDVFGWLRKDGTRKYRTVYIEVPRKQGKSTLGAGIALYLLLADGELGCEVYSAAADRDQARIIFDIARLMIDNSPVLAMRAAVYRNSIVSMDRTRVYKPLSADAHTKHGFNTHGIIFDELHAQPDRELWDVLTTSVGSRRQPLTWAMTTAGFDKNSICWEMHEYARKVADGVIHDETFYSLICTAPINDDIYDEATWAKANPGLGTIAKIDYLREAVNKVKFNPSFENTFRRLHLNQWVTSSVRWLPDDVWMRCAEELPDLTGRKVYGGLDLSNYTDISALILFAAPTDTLPGAVLCHFWLPEDRATVAQVDRVDYMLWAKQGYIELTPGNVIAHEYIYNRAVELMDKYKMIRIGYDPWNAVQVVTKMADAGITMSEFRQGFASMSAPTKKLESMVLSGALIHGGNPVLRWMASNVSLRIDPAGNVKVDKAKSREKVDGIVALAMAVGEWMTDEMSGDTGQGVIYLDFNDET